MHKAKKSRFMISTKKLKLPDAGNGMNVLDTYSEWSGTWEKERGLRVLSERPAIIAFSF